MIIFIFSHLISIAQIANKEAYEGNKLYASGQFKEAESKYQSSLKNQQNKEIQYNLGNALYQQKKWDEANKQFTSVANVAKDKHLKSIANHNIGNAFLEQKKWDEAIQYFKQSLKQNPHSFETKYNLAYAQKMKQNQQNQNKDKNNQDKQNQQNQDKKENQDKNENQDKEDKGQQPQNQQPQESQKNNRPQPQPSKLTKDQAEQLLNALNQEEKKLKEKKEKEKGQPVRLEKDW
ncbi:MAG TPA: tetratricopeptide repeat protein [Chitinophagaceae bacterium]|nr:tetratricopeptide repeat protein [Chitinophagaceae bacterium]